MAYFDEDDYEYDEYAAPDLSLWKELSSNNGVPVIVSLAIQGDAKRVAHLIKSGVTNVDARRCWIDVQEKYGDAERLEWFDNSALMVATLRGHSVIVEQLLLAGADPMLKSCTVDDKYHTALEIAQKYKNDNNKKNKRRQIIYEMIDAVNTIWEELNPNCEEQPYYQANKVKKIVPTNKSIVDAIENVKTVFYAKTKK